ncbi:MAG: helix-turn-helix domain-containing protein [Betaproteobacteria bacterium]|nr:helix-turn-helix domain-containing protein [Betaproteobacteria bacterium]
MVTAEDRDAAEQPIGQAQSLAPLGEVLLSARLAKKLSLKDVSDSLRYSVRQIEALENNDFSTLPEPMITRGFIRNYARYLALDAEPLLASYRVCVPDVLHHEVSVKSTVKGVSFTRESQPWIRYILLSSIVVVFLIAWLFYVNNPPKPADSDVPQVAPPPKAIAEPMPAAEMQLPEPALPMAERMATEATVETNQANAQGESVSSNATEVVSEGIQPVASAVSRKDTLPATQTAQMPSQSAQESDISADQPPLDLARDVVKKKVSISVTEKTWVSVTDSSGKVVLEKMLVAGSMENFDATPPLNVVVGNAKATKLTFATQSVDLTTPAGSNVARLRLE